MTARRAIDALALRGLVERRGRVGVTVARPKTCWDLTSVAGLHEQLSRQGITLGADVLRVETLPAGGLDPNVGDSYNCDLTRRFMSSFAGSRTPEWPA